MPPSEPTPADIAAVSAVVDNTPAPTTPPPAPEPAPAQQQPATPTSQPAPSQQPAGDPFEALFAPTEPTATPAPTQPTEPVAPPTQPTEPVTTPQPTQTPVETPQPTPNAPTNAPVYQSYDDFMKEVLGETTPTPLPDHSKIAPDDEEGIKNFFDEIVNTAVARAEQKIRQQNAIQNTERKLWDDAFDKYGSLRTNKNLRDMVHNIRMGEFRRGVALTPTQAAEKVLDALKQQYNKGVADNSVVTTIVDNQPNNGGGGQPVATTLDKESVLTAVQTGGETALASYLDNEVKAGRL